MILPTKHIRPERCLLHLGANILSLLEQPKTVSSLWNTVRQRPSIERVDTLVDYRWFVLCLDFLFAVGTIRIQKGLIQRTAQ